jgi:hypothetical protein
MITHRTTAARTPASAAAEPDWPGRAAPAEHPDPVTRREPEQLAVRRGRSWRLSAGRSPAPAPRAPCPPWPPCPQSAARDHYDPWEHLRRSWPAVTVVQEPMTGDLLGELRGASTIALRADTSSAQRRCTLAHEIVHLERGVVDCGPWLGREESLVHLTASRRLIGLAELARALRDLGGPDDRAALAQLLEVDSETLQLRLARLTTAERRGLHSSLRASALLWSLA